jgi:hypothetical protein
MDSFTLKSQIKELVAQKDNFLAQSKTVIDEIPFDVKM